ncbi:uncharacterized protein LY89DRAFT_589613 [Mollisia scopiformis]|uniref:Zn(2)-C6 fungal-type domain-containing protein n=1 Tax=Mollisia scopiformis TaxID=149040 RepID=A0A194X295_MOLSC|nr:uncharacterized protein LY89DRAFT_589613 [Mollisia scopiformis]KUJ14325.1 hypothetical protein LY89DRAFT_589613 [Mollisia scopiformis]
MARKGSPKVRSGCRTCKKRKVKCDEFRPACRRCSSTGRTCGGYDLELDREQDREHYNALQHSISLYRPKQLTARDEQEGRSFNFFAHVVSPVLSGPMDTYFWTHLVMQFSHFTPAVRHASIAVSSLYEDFLGGSRIFRQKNNLLALKHYNAAIQEIGANPDQDEQLVLMVCVLFVCIELLQGNPEAASRHCKHGIAILQKFNVDSGRTPSDWVVRYLLPIFRRLSLNLFIPSGPPSPARFSKGDFPPPPSIMLLENGPDSGSVPDRFDTIVEASNSLDELMATCMSISHAKDDASTQDQMHKKGQLRESLQLWNTRISEFESSATSLSVADQLALCNMRMRYEKQKIDLGVRAGPKSFAEELQYDQYTSTFKSIVALARQAASLSTSAYNGQRQSFSFDMGFLPVLQFVVMKCRDFDTRIEALSWMPHLTAAKESLLDLGTLYRISRRVIELEHNVSLDDDLRARDDETAKLQLTSEDSRIVAAPVDHEMEVITAQDGTVSYRRRVLIIMRHADNSSSFDREILQERKLRQYDLEIPGMRSAR